MEHQGLAAPEKDITVAEGWLGRSAHADRYDINLIVDAYDVQDMDMLQLSYLNDCSLCIKGAMKNRPMPLPAHVEVRPGAAIPTDVTVMNVLSIGGAKYFDTFIVEAPCHLRAFHVKWKGEAAELLKLQDCWSSDSLES